MTRIGTWLFLALVLGSQWCGNSPSHADDPVWKAIPSSARAVTVVRNMEAFSDKVDHVARFMEIESPHVLDYAMSESKIRKGLDLTGNLAWVVRPQKGPPGEKSIGRLYLLPTTDYKALIAPLSPRDPVDGLHAVTVVNRPAYVAPVEGIAVFAFLGDGNALRENLVLDATVEAEIAPHAPWLEQQDVYVFLTKEGIEQGGQKVTLPLSRGNAFLEPLLEGVQVFATSTGAEATDAQSMSLGVAISEDHGVSLNCRLHTGPNADLSRVFPAQPPRREDTLNRLREGPIAQAIGGYLSPQIIEAVNLKFQEILVGGSSEMTLTPEELEKWTAHRAKVKIDVQRFQFGVYVPALPPPEKVIAEDNPKLEKGKPPAPEEKPEEPFQSPPHPNQLALVRSLVLVLTVENSKEALTAIENWFVTMPVPLEKVIGDPDLAEIITPRRVEYLGLPCLQSGDFPPNPGVPVDWPHLIIAPADDRSLVVVCGGVKELEQALVPFQALGRNILHQEIVHEAVACLPTSSATVAVFDGGKIASILSLLLSSSEGMEFQALMLQTYSGLIQEDSLLALGACWENSRLDITARLTPEFMKTLGVFGTSFGLFRSAVNGPIPKGNIKK